MASLAVEPHRWTREEYDQLVAAGVFAGARVELVEGVIYDMTPQSSRHGAGVRKMRRALERICPAAHEVITQLPLDLSLESEPEPDAAIVPSDPDDWALSHPTSALLVVEIADSSLRYDRKTKMRLYARGGIPEAWLLNLTSDALEVYRDPDRAAGAYTTRLDVARDAAVSPLFSPQAAIKVASLIPRQP
jgi:Uma2 family endonuclease